VNVEQIWVAIASLISLGLGFWLGWRDKRVAVQLARAEGRAESSLELARFQQQVDFLEQTMKQLREALADKQQHLEGTLDRATQAESEVIQLRERVNHLTLVKSSLEREREEAVETARALTEQRERASRLAAEIAAADSAIRRADERLVELSALELTLRSMLAERDKELVESREMISRTRAELESANARVSALIDRQAQLEAEIENLQGTVLTLSNGNTELQTLLAAERKVSKERVAFLESAREELSAQLRAVAAEIMEEKGEKLTEKNAAALTQILQPLKENISEFRAWIDEVHRTDGQERAALGERLKQLIDLNHTLSTDAQNLTRALKGDQKTQGIWGEIVLDSVLEQAGLIEGMHYDRQSSFEGEDQKRSIPDVVLRLPGERQLVIDSKVSLTAYERAVNAATPDERDAFIKQHIISLRNHIRSLSEKNYQHIYELKSLDFVLLFVPLEPAFAAAVSNDNQIFREAWDRNVIIVSPSTMLFVVRTVAYLWRQESQARNVMEIAKRGALLYDKFCGFVEDLEDVGRRIQQSAKAYDAAMRKLGLGDGNLIRQAEMLRDLGVKPSKQLPIKLVDRAQSNIQQSLITDAPEPAGGSGLDASASDAQGVTPVAHDVSPASS
jgi:DNA recombination protein RmuC